jgi:hypothetical protein
MKSNQTFHTSRTIQTKNKVKCYKNSLQVYRLLISGHPVVYQLTEHLVIVFPLPFCPITVRHRHMHRASNSKQ